MKIAKITAGNPNNKKGQFNNVTERIRFLQAKNPSTDAFMIRHYDDLLFKLLKRNFTNTKKEEYTTVDGILYKNLWVKHRLIDYLLTFKLNKKAISTQNQLYKYVDWFKEYDLISPHGISSIFLASLVKRKHKIPFVPTWHGSDINLAPFRNKKLFQYMQILLKEAAYNFFVSKRLKEKSDEIVVSENKGVLYTGPASIFLKYNEIQKQKLLQEFTITTKHVIGFIGNLSAVKNVLVLPLIFKELQNKYQDISFVIVGNGNLGISLEEQCKEHEINNIYFLGKQEPSKIPDIMNCLDVLILPSLNEGMPRVTLEAQSCGVHVVGSDRGGIPEAIGQNNCFTLEDDFVKNISNRIIEMLKNNEKPNPLSDEFSWTKAIEKETKIYKDAIEKSNNVAK